MDFYIVNCVFLFEMHNKVSMGRKYFLEIVVMRTYRTSLLWHSRQTARHYNIFVQIEKTPVSMNPIASNTLPSHTSYTIRILCDMASVCLTLQTRCLASRVRYPRVRSDRSGWIKESDIVVGNRVLITIEGARMNH